MRGRSERGMSKRNTKRILKRVAQYEERWYDEREVERNYFLELFRRAEFQWDEDKDRINYRKHGLHFVSVITVFKDPYALILEDTSHSWEKRYDMIGKANVVVFVVFTVRNETFIRLISARRATKNEEERYGFRKNDMG